MVPGYAAVTGYIAAGMGYYCVVGHFFTILVLEYSTVQVMT